MNDPKHEKINELAHQSPCLCFNIRKASRVITQIYDEALREIGYTPSQVMILSSLQELRSANINELAEAVCTDRTTLSRNLRPLKRDGLLRPCDCHDRREKAIMLTEKGKKVVEQSTLIWKTIHHKILKAAGPEHVAGFIKDLNSILTSIQKG